MIQNMKQLVSQRFYGFLWVFAVSIFLLHYLVAGQAVYGDGIGYYAHLHSWYFDQDWNYTNEYQHIYSPENNNREEPLQSPTIQIVKTTISGVAENHYSPGIAVLLLPFYVVADILVRLAQFVSLPVAANGYSNPYQIVVGIGAVSYVIAGLYLLENLQLKMVQNALITRLSILVTFLGTHLLYYGSFDVINSHFASFFLSVAFFYVLFQYPRSFVQSAVLGFIAGLAATVRIQDGVLLMVWWIDLGIKIYSQRERLSWSLIKNTALFHLGLVIGLLPSLYHTISVFGSPLQHRYLLGFLAEREQGKTISWLGSLFHPTTGLFTVTPILAVVFGYFLYLLYKRKITHSIWLLFSFFVLQYGIITVHTGWQAAAFGGRMFISSLPFFAVLLALLLEKLKERNATTKLILFVLLVIVVNFWQMGNFILFGKGAEGGKIGTEERTLQRINSFKQTLIK